MPGIIFQWTPAKNQWSLESEYDRNNDVTTLLSFGIFRKCFPLYQLSSLVALWADSSPLVMKVDTRDCKSRCNSRHLTVITQCNTLSMCIMCVLWFQLHAVWHIRIIQKGFSTGNLLKFRKFSVLVIHKLILIFPRLLPLFARAEVNIQYVLH